MHSTPVQRLVSFTMYRNGTQSEKAFKKKSCGGEVETLYETCNAMKSKSKAHSSGQYHQASS